MTILRHLHLPGFTPYAHSAALQSRLVAAQLAHKAKASRAPPIPDPTIITAQFQPVYTCGRREVGSVSAEQIAHLTAATPWGRATFVEALRGGQTTFHGPGQLVAYPIVDLKRHGLTPRCYVRLLEKSVMKVCEEYGVRTRTTEHPGVWTMDEERKICAVGVHLRRNVTSHGVGLNVDTEMGWFERIVGCGLEGKTATSLAIERGEQAKLDVEDVGDQFVRVFAEALGGVDAVLRVGEEDLD